MLRIKAAEAGGTAKGCPGPGRSPPVTTWAADAAAASEVPGSTRRWQGSVEKRPWARSTRGRFSCGFSSCPAWRTLSGTPGKETPSSGGLRGTGTRVVGSCIYFWTFSTRQTSRIPCICTALPGRRRTGTDLVLELKKVLSVKVRLIK